MTTAAARPIVGQRLRALFDHRAVAIAPQPQRGRRGEAEECTGAARDPGARAEAIARELAGREPERAADQPGGNRRVVDREPTAPERCGTHHRDRGDREDRARCARHPWVARHANVRPDVRERHPAFVARLRRPPATASARLALPRTDCQRLATTSGSRLSSSNRNNMDYWNIVSTHGGGLPSAQPMSIGTAKHPTLE